MARFVGLAGCDGDTVYVNPDTVAYIEETGDEDTSEVVFSCPDSLRCSVFVAGTPLEVATALGMGEPLVMGKQD